MRLIEGEETRVGGDGPRRSSASRVPRWAIGFLALGLVLTGCSRGDRSEGTPPEGSDGYGVEWTLAELLPEADAWAATRGGAQPVVEATSFGLSREQLANLYERNRVLMAYEHASAEDKRAVLETWVEKELLVLAARDAVGDPPPALARRIRVDAENALIELHTEVLRDLWRPDSLLLEQAVANVSREADVYRITVASRERAEAGLAALKAGMSFEEAHSRYSETGDASLMHMGWRSAVGVPPRVARVIFYDDLPVGTPSRVVATARGNWIVKVDAYRPLDLSQAGAQGIQIEKLAEKVLERDAISARSDSMQSALGMRILADAVAPLIGRAVAGYVDSVKAVSEVQGRAMQWPLRAPIWRMEQDHWDTPVYELEGRTYTVRDLFRRLDLVDLEFWPMRADSLAAYRAIEYLAGRHAVAADARNMGLLQAPVYLRKLRSVRDEAYFDWWRESLERQIVVTEAQADSVYHALAPWTLPERRAVSVVMFPEGEVDLSEAFSRDMQGTDRTRWREASMSAEAAIDGVRLLDNLEPFSRDVVPPSVDLLPLREAAFELQPDEVSEVVMVGGKGCIVRVLSVVPERAVPEGQAKEMAVREIRLARLDALIESALERRREAQRVIVHADRL